MTSDDHIGRGILFSVATFACFSTADAFVKMLSAGYSVLLIYFVTTLFAALPIGLLIWRSKRPLVFRPRHPRAVALRCLFLALDTFGAYLAFSRLPLANAYTLIFAAPLIVTMLSPLVLGEAVGRHRWSAVVIGFLGIVVVLRPGLAPLDIGYFGALGAACMFALALLVTRQIGGRESSTTLLFWLIAGKLAASGLFLPFVYVPIPLADLGVMLVIGILVGGAQICIVQAFRSAPPATVAPFQYTQMLWAVLYGFLFFGDVPDRYVIAGSALVVISGLYILWREHINRRRRSL